MGGRVEWLRFLYKGDWKGLCPRSRCAQRFWQGFHVVCCRSKRRSQPGVRSW